jgi:group II intron reverse transcriptase/maturase
MKAENSAYQLSLPWGGSGEAASEPGRAEPSPVPVRGDPGASGSGLWGQVFSRENLTRALKRVEQNKGAPGIDGMTVAELRPYLKGGWSSIRAALDGGTYVPAPVRQKGIPKPDGGTRYLGIPTVLDRLIQQALLQALTPLFDPLFSASSFGFRPGRSAHQAVKQAQAIVREGSTWAVDLDIEKFFDRVNHDKLMARVARVVEDKRVLRLIRAYLEAGVMVSGVVAERTEGTPQGGPLSPLLANIMLHDLDRELESRGHRFVRYADDLTIYVRSRRAGERVMESVSRYLSEVLRLRVNRVKSAVDRAWRRSLLGFSFYASASGIRIRVAQESYKRCREKLRQLTRRNSGKAIGEHVRLVNEYLMGWVGYFALGDARGPLEELDKWLRHRLRQILWKQWKRFHTRYRNLVALGADPENARLTAGHRRRHWFASGTSAMNQALPTAFWTTAGLTSATARSQLLRSRP